MTGPRKVSVERLALVNLLVDRALQITGGRNDRTIDYGDLVVFGGRSPNEVHVSVYRRGVKGKLLSANRSAAGVHLSTFKGGIWTEWLLRESRAAVAPIHSHLSGGFNGG